MTVNELIIELRKQRREGYGQVEVHIIAHDNCDGETQGCVHSVRFYEKDPSEPPDYYGRDKNLYEILPSKVVYLGN